MSREIVYFDDFSTRRCRFFSRVSSADDGYGCSHPENPERQRVGRYKRGHCASMYCPLGSELAPSEDADDAALMRAEGMDPETCSDYAWIALHGKPTSVAP